jgi:hypothetical protein
MGYYKRTENPEIVPYKYSQEIFDKSIQAIQWRIVFSTNCAEAIHKTKKLILT